MTTKVVTPQNETEALALLELLLGDLQLVIETAKRTPGQVPDSVTVS